MLARQSENRPCSKRNMAYAFVCLIETDMIKNENINVSEDDIRAEENVEKLTE